MINREFSTAVFYRDETYKYVARFVTASKALLAASLQSRTAMRDPESEIERIVVTDGGDFTVFEWKKGEGITWPEDYRNML
jgi:hypothetical protein